MMKFGFIKKRNDKWCVFSHKKKKGKHHNFGCFDTKEKAKKRLGQIYFFKTNNASDKSNLGEQLNRLRPEIANAAQRVIDEWDQNEEGFDEVFGSGGACDEISSEIINIIYDKIPEVEAVFGAPEGEDHEWVVVKNNNEVFIIDIPPNIYEEGAGYNWEKIQNAKISPKDIYIEQLDSAGDLFNEANMENILLKLANKLEKMGEINNSHLIKVMSLYVKSEMTPNPTVPEVKLPSKTTKLPRKKLEWPFPSYSILSNIDNFVVYSLSKPEYNAYKKMPRGGVTAARKEITHLYRETASSFYKELEIRISEARRNNDKGQIENIKKWLTALNNAIKMLKKLDKELYNYRII